MQLAQHQGERAAVLVHSRLRLCCNAVQCIAGTFCFPGCQCTLAPCSCYGSHAALYCNMRKSCTAGAKVSMRKPWLLLPPCPRTPCPGNCRVGCALGQVGLTVMGRGHLLTPSNALKVARALVTAAGSVCMWQLSWGCSGSFQSFLVQLWRCLLAWRQFKAQCAIRCGLCGGRGPDALCTCLH